MHVSIAPRLTPARAPRPGDRLPSSRGMWEVWGCHPMEKRSRPNAQRLWGPPWRWPSTARTVLGTRCSLPPGQWSRPCLGAAAQSTGAPKAHAKHLSAPSGADGDGAGSVPLQPAGGPAPWGSWQPPCAAGGWQRVTAARPAPRRGSALRYPRGAAGPGPALQPRLPYLFICCTYLFIGRGEGAPAAAHQSTRLLARRSGLRPAPGTARTHDTTGLFPRSNLPSSEPAPGTGRWVR